MIDGEPTVEILVERPHNATAFRIRVRINSEDEVIISAWDTNTEELLPVTIKDNVISIL